MSLEESKKVKLSYLKYNTLGSKFKTLQNEQGEDIVCPVTPPMILPNDLGKIEIYKAPCTNNCIGFELLKDDSGKNYFGCRCVKIKYEIKDAD